MFSHMFYHTLNSFEQEQDLIASDSTDDLYSWESG